MVTGWLGRLQGGRTRDGGAGILINTAREIVGRRRSLQGGLNEVRHPSVLDALSESDFAFLEVTVAERVISDREFATVLARLTHHAARSKGFDRQTVDSALRLEPLLPADDPNREREKLLRDAYAAAQRSGYIRGGRQTLARLAQRFLESGDTERARALFKQELEITGEEHDTQTEIDVAIQLGDLCRRDADTATALELYRRAGRSAQRLDYSRGIAEALQRQTEMLPPGTSVEDSRRDAASSPRCCSKDPRPGAGEQDRGRIGRLALPRRKAGGCGRPTRLRAADCPGRSATCRWNPDA